MFSDCNEREVWACSVGGLDSLTPLVAIRHRQMCKALDAANGNDIGVSSLALSRVQFSESAVLVNSVDPADPADPGLISIVG